MRQYVAKPSIGNVAALAVRQRDRLRAEVDAYARAGRGEELRERAAGSRTMGRSPFFSALLRKMSAMRVETTAWKP